MLQADADDVVLRVAAGDYWQLDTGKVGAATIPLINPPSDTEAAKTAPIVSTYTFPGPNLTPAETWTMGHRTPYGLAFAPDGKLWEVEHGPRGGDERKGDQPGAATVRHGAPPLARLDSILVRALGFKCERLVKRPC